MSKRSAGLILYRRNGEALEVLLVHPGGPFWARKDLGAWSIPKGEYTEGEDALSAARREFEEETGFSAPANCLALGELKQAGGKMVSAWAAEGDCDPARLVSNTCQIEWPPRSRRFIEIPEADRGAWFSLDEARKKMFRGQEAFLERLQDALG